MTNGFGRILGSIFAGVVAFSALNALLFNLGNLQRWDFILANALLIILIYFIYLTYEIQQIKNKIEEKSKRGKR